jgi:cob(I)alamin adenosyltransferase
MKIYTKTGDKGETSLIGGKRVPKYHPRIEAYGTIDELIAFVGLLRDQNLEKRVEDNLLNIQDKLMVCAAILATDCEDCKIKIPSILDEDIEYLEKEIDSMQTKLPELKYFLLPGGNNAVSLCHIIRTICRRAERKTLKLSEELFVPDSVLIYLNRLSDYFFVLSRKLSVDFKAIEHLWKPKL